MITSADMGNTRGDNEIRRRLRLAFQGVDVDGVNIAEVVKEHSEVAWRWKLFLYE